MSQGCLINRCVLGPAVTNEWHQDPSREKTALQYAVLKKVGMFSVEMRLDPYLTPYTNPNSK